MKIIKFFHRRQINPITTSNIPNTWINIIASVIFVLHKTPIFARFISVIYNFQKIIQIEK